MNLAGAHSNARCDGAAKERGGKSDSGHMTRVLVRTAFLASVVCFQYWFVGGSSQANRLMRNAAMDDSIGGSQGVTGLRVQ